MEEKEENKSENQGGKENRADKEEKSSDTEKDGNSSTALGPLTPSKSEPSKDDGCDKESQEN